jgi:hypothetical protein
MAQNATSSKLDVGLSHGQFELSSPLARRQDIGVSSGLGGGSRVHQTKPISATTSKRRRPAQSPVPAAMPAVPPAEAPPRTRLVLWLGLLLAFLVTAVLGSMIIYYQYFFPDS